MGPIVGGIYAELGSALIIIMIGILSETRGVNKRSVAANLLGLFLMLVTAGLDLAVLPLLALYMMFGIAVFLKKWRKLFFFFSSKMYGCLMLAIAILHIPATQQAVSAMVPFSLVDWVSIVHLVFASTAFVNFYWLIAAPFAYLAAYVFKRKYRR